MTHPLCIKLSVMREGFPEQEAEAALTICSLISAAEDQRGGKAGAGSDGLAVRKPELRDLTQRNGTRTFPAIVPSGICK